MPHRLSKSRYTAGIQCHKLLWWKVHEPLAVELQPDKVLQDRFDQGAQVGTLARRTFAGGTLVDLPHHAVAERVALTRKLINERAPAIFEASFLADNTFVAVDALTPVDGGFHLTEVKSSSSQKEEHLPDVAVQIHVLAQSGIKITGADVMHLNKECHYPDLTNLFERTDVTAAVAPLLNKVGWEIEAQLRMLEGPLPDVAIGLHCHEPYKCPFMERCWPRDRDHIMKLSGIGPIKGCDFMLTGVNRIPDLPASQKLNVTQKRQIRAMKEGRIIVDPGLKKALEAFDGRLGFLDFETIQRAVPVWPGMAPWEQAPAQFSYHEANGDGTYTHAEYLAEGPKDCRPELARAMVAATKRAERVVTYSHFEKTKIRGLQEAVPDLRAELEALEGKLIDLLPVVRENVYHPDFLGSFSLKYVLHPLVPELTYNDLVIVDGLVASVEIARLLFVAGKIAPEEQSRVRQDLLNYCERDTWAMVKVLEKLRELVSRPGEHQLRFAE
jgi:predicted RecB family nuclease